ncbi:hypothetical protein PRN20_03015 [Devosia sp. ZB163]|uniref:hypothetical protein n=1 Tax=Devosia sp. ZB163 TaxID=3025938 RepID=UPI002360F829|nr:hypothetical protein [Devosia sp. ZB163]MDC9822693.1 hypothetical protein [Devosia sp. ZB163]
MKRLIIALSCLAAAPALASETDVLRRLGRPDVLCLHQYYVSVQAATKLCHWPRSAVDDAIDASVLRIESYLISIAPVHVDAALASQRKWLFDMLEVGDSEVEMLKACQEWDGIAALATLRSSFSNGEQIERIVDTTLAGPPPERMVC